MVNHRRLAKRSRRNLRNNRQSMWYKLPNELLGEIHKYLPLGDIHSLGQSSKGNAAVCNSYLSDIFWKDDTLRHRIPQYRWPFLQGNTQPRERVNEGKLEWATTLQYAIYKDDAEAVPRLIESGRDVNESLRDDWNGCARSPLGLAARFGNKRIILMLMRAGALLEWNEPDGYDTLLIAKNSEVVTWITEEWAKLRGFKRNL